MSDAGSPETPLTPPDRPQPPLTEIARKYEKPEQRAQSAFLKELEEKADIHGAMGMYMSMLGLSAIYWGGHVSNFFDRGQAMIQNVQNPTIPHLAFVATEALTMSAELGLVTVGTAVVSAAVGHLARKQYMKVNQR